jgi:hypothetical protein
MGGSGAGNLTNSLELAGDGIADTYDALQAAFGLTADDWPDRRFETLGELEDFLWSRVGDARNTDDGARMLTMAFLRLRAVIAAPQRLTPKSPLAPLAGSNPRRFFRELSAATGLELPSLGVTRRGGWAAFAFFLAAPFCGGMYSETHSLALLMVALAAWPLMVAVLWTDPGRLPAGLANLGDLARQAVPLNYRKLADSGDRVGREGFRDAMISILAEASDTTVPREAIGRDTRLLATLH